MGLLSPSAPVPRREVRAVKRDSGSRVKPVLFHKGTEIGGARLSVRWCWAVTPFTVWIQGTQALLCRRTPACEPAEVTQVERGL